MRFWADGLRRESLPKLLIQGKGDAYVNRIQCSLSKCVSSCRTSEFPGFSTYCRHRRATVTGVFGCAFHAFFSGAFCNFDFCGCGVRKRNSYRLEFGIGSHSIFYRSQTLPASPLTKAEIILLQGFKFFNLIWYSSINVQYRRDLVCHFRFSHCFSLLSFNLAFCDHRNWVYRYRTHLSVVPKFLLVVSV